ncbi:MAG: hypothetical protein AABX38_00500 [Candidatus Micrarchaeota archaeon]
MHFPKIKTRLISAVLLSTVSLSCNSKPKTFDSKTQLLVEVLYCNDSRNDPSKCVVKYIDTKFFEEGTNPAILNNQIRQANEKVNSIVGACDIAGFHTQDGINRFYPDVRVRVELFNSFDDGKFFIYSNKKQTNPVYLCLQSP